MGFLSLYCTVLILETLSAWVCTMWISLPTLCSEDILILPTPSVMIPLADSALSVLSLASCWFADPGSECPSSAIVEAVTVSSEST